MKSLILLVFLIIPTQIEPPIDILNMDHDSRQRLLHDIRSTVLSDHSGLGLTREQVFTVLRVAHELERGPIGISEPDVLFGSDVPAAMKLVETRWNINSGYTCKEGVGCFPPGYLGPGD